MSAGGRLTVALYTIRHVLPGEELTFDYASVTESEDEFKQAFCMCSMRQCRGSYLHYTSKAYMQVSRGGRPGWGVGGWGVAAVVDMRRCNASNRPRHLLWLVLW